MNYSRQRNIILDIVKSSYDHPTAEEVYALAVKELPSIGIATVYRNLNQLSELGEIKRISLMEGSDRFDGQLEEHYHMVCDCCGRLTDLKAEDSEIMSLKKKICDTFKVSERDELKLESTLLRGVCDSCKKTIKRRS